LTRAISVFAPCQGGPWFANGAWREHNESRHRVLQLGASQSFCLDTWHARCRRHDLGFNPLQKAGLNVPGLQSVHSITSYRNVPSEFAWRQHTPPHLRCMRGRPCSHAHLACIVRSCTCIAGSIQGMPKSVHHTTPSPRIHLAQAAATVRPHSRHIISSGCLLPLRSTKFEAQILAHLTTKMLTTVSMQGALHSS